MPHSSTTIVYAKSNFLRQYACSPGNIVAQLEKPFPILVDLQLRFTSSVVPFDPDPSKFLGGGSTSLRSLTLDGIKRVPDLLKLLLSTPNLVILRLDRIEHTHNPGSFIYDEIVTVLSALTRLEELVLQVNFRPDPYFENQNLLLLTRTALPSLTVLKLKGTPKNLDDFVVRIDTPLLDHLHITFSFFVFGQVISHDVPQILSFIGRIPNLQAPDGAYIGFDDNNIKMWINFLWSTRISRRVLKLETSCLEPEKDFPCLARFCRSPSFPFHPLESLYIGEGRFLRNHRENTRWLKLLQPLAFADVKNLYLTKEFAIHIAHALQELVGERVMEVLPTLENVFIDGFDPSGPIHEVINEFVAARRLAGHPILLSRWDNKNAMEDIGS